MNDPEVIRYVNEVIRPMSERARDLRDDIANALATWHGGIGAAVTADLAAAVEDGREAQGVSRLTCNDVVGTMALLTNVAAVLNAEGVAAVIAKSCVNVRL